ncbi:response regulator [Paenibacillus thalictri]|uniref:Response regulator n=1 Tax=Paenibacillus thalictri TaxID=2527873 RepID=A0A4Q9DNV6_9BACL|nr:response regulator [Paenibacillus thalictri]TBL76589.1 response regulator [Paenibacillus thalictri]
MNDAPYTLCIIDDMEDAVESLVKNIPWHDYNISVCGTATNGRDGLDLMKELKPDIVLTDIRMPHMDGLEMVSSVLQDMPGVKIIIMSGYSDFQYAQKAIRLGAADYLIKPLTPLELGNTMGKVISLLEKEREQRLQEQSIEKKMNASMPILVKEHLNLLIRYETSREAAERRWRDLQLKLGNGQFVVMVAEIDDWPLSDDRIQIQEAEIVRYAVQKIWEETILESAGGIVFPDAYSNRIVSIIHDSAQMDPRKLGEESRINIGDYSKYKVSIGVSLVVPIEQLPRAYNQALTALSYNFYTGGNSIFCFSDYQLGMVDTARCETEKEKELLLCLRAGNADKMTEIMGQMVDHYCDVRQLSAPDDIISRGNELMFLMKRELLDIVPAEHAALIDKEMTDLRKSNTASVQSMKQQLYDMCRVGCGLIQKEQESEAIRLVNEAVEFIDRSLSDNLTIGDYAAHVHLSTSYFAKVFKKTKGLTVHQYVIREKIAMAQKMLLHDKQVQEIAQELGFEDRRYFTEVFKKHTGATPTEWRSGQ